MSELLLRNNATSQSLTVTPALRLPDGTETILAPVIVMPQEVKSINLDAAIAAANAPQLVQAFGSVVLRYRAPFAAGLYAAMMIHRTGHPIAVHIDATGESKDLQSGSREGVWWLPNDTTSDYLVLTNLGKNTIPLALSLYDAGGKESKQTLSLGPGVTTRYSVRALVRTAGLTGSYGGIKISTSIYAGSLDTLHFLFDETVGFSATLKMFHYDPGATLDERDFAQTGVWTLHAPMLALSSPDPALAFPPGISLQPQLFIRNTTGRPINAALRFNWRSGTAVGKAPGPALQLNPYETRLIDVAALQDGIVFPKQANWASVAITTNSKPDELVAVAASYDATLRYGAQTPFSDQLTFKWEGGRWEYDAYHDSIITAGNGGTKATQAAFTIFYNQGTQRYDLEQTLQPDEQMWMDVGKLIRERVPDKNGNTLPADLTFGSYEFRDLTNKGVGTLFEGKVIYDKTYGSVAYGCAKCCGFQVPITLWYDPLGVPLDSTAFQGVYAPDGCNNGQLTDVSESFYNNWTTGSTSIATVDTYGTHTGVSVGSTTSYTNGRLIDNHQFDNCPVLMRTPSGPTNVVKLSCSPSSATRGSTVTCSVSNAPSGSTFSQWKFTDAGNNTVSRTGNNNFSSWSGTVVTSGTVSVMVASGNGSATPPASVTVNNRNWHTNPASPVEVSNGTFFTLPVPPQPNGDLSGLGSSSYKIAYNALSYSTISDGGPNQGYTYWPSNPTFSTFNYQYEINPDLENSGSTFSQHQCGNYNASTNPNGFISWANLLAQTQRHEYNSAVQSHYAFYSISLNSNNLGDYVEQQIATPGADPGQFATNTQSGINSRLSTIQSATAVEPFPVNYSETGTLLGYINYAPYTTCN
jgi:hypothetical protein